MSTAKTAIPKPTSTAQRSITSLSSTQSSPSRSGRRAIPAETYIQNRTKQQPAAAQATTYPSKSAAATTAQQNDLSRQGSSASRKYDYDQFRVPVPDTLGMSMANGMWGQSVGNNNNYNQAGASQFKDEFKSDDYDDGTDESMRGGWQGNGDEQSNVSFFQEDTFPALSDTTNDFKDGGKDYVDYDDHYSDDNDNTQYPAANSPKRTRLAESALPKEENMNDYYSEDDYKTDSEIDKKVEDTKRRLSLERQQLYPKSIPPPVAAVVSKSTNGKAPERTASTRSKTTTTTKTPAVIRTKSPEPRKSLSFGGSPEPVNGRGQSGHSLSRKRDYSMLKEVNFQSLAQQKWHQTSATSRPQAQAKSPSAATIYAQPGPSVSMDEHSRQQVAFFSSLPPEDFYKQREALMKQLQDLLDESKNIREDFIKGVMQMEEKINSRSSIVESRRGQINQYMDNVKEKLRGVTTGGAF